MRKRCKPWILCWGITLLLVLVTASGQAAVVSGVKFADTLVLEQTRLTIRGAGVLTWALFFDVYAGVLYLPEGHPGGAWNENVPKRLELSYFRDIAADDFAKSADVLLRRSLSEPEYRNLAERLEKFNTLYRDVRPGDRYSLTYRPEIGTELRFNGELLGSVAGEDFAQAYFGIWLGSKPISETFRDQLLLP